MSFWGSVAGAGIMGGSSIGGALIQRGGTRKAQKRAWKYQKKAMKNAVSWRVADAKRAGIHPLYALGAPAVGAGIQAFGGGELGKGIADAGQAIGQAVSRMPSKEERNLADLQTKLLQSQINESDARKNLYDSEAARNRQTALSQAAGASAQLGIMQEGGLKTLGPPNPFIYRDNQSFIYEQDLNARTATFPRSLSDLPGAGIYETLPAERRTHRKGNKGLEAGPGGPGFKTFFLPNGMPIDLPAGDTLSEVMEETPFWMWPGIYKYNKKKYGVKWAEKMKDFMLPWRE